MRHIPDVTLVMLAGSYVAQAEAALADIGARVSFDQVLVFAERPLSVATVVGPMTAGADFTRVVRRSVFERMRGLHALFCDWDGYPMNAGCWDDGFREYDYIGAVWPWFPDGAVGNSGFSLQSKTLLRLLYDGAVVPSHPGDISLCRTHRSALGSAGIRFAPEDVADRFSVEHGPAYPRSFGFHGIWNLLYFMDDDAIMARLALLDAEQWKRPQIDTLMYRALVDGRRALYRRVLAEKRQRDRDG